MEVSIFDFQVFLQIDVQCDIEWMIFKKYKICYKIQDFYNFKIKASNWSRTKQNPYL